MVKYKEAFKQIYGCKGESYMKKSFMNLSCLLVFSMLFTGCGTTNSTEVVESTSSDIVENADGTHTHADGTVHNADHTDVVEEETEKVVEEKVVDFNSLKYFAEINVKDYGTIKLALDYDTAPRTVDNFVKLVNEGFYDGLTFHRIMDGFMIQGGCPLGNGMGGSANSIKGEFAANGVENSISHKRGVISMARAYDMDSASSQFFIVQTDSVFLDGQYAGFGYVTEGMDVVDKICADSSPVDNNGTITKDAQPVITSVTVSENPNYVAPVEVEEDVEA